jgi:hypothetical protein
MGPTALLLLRRKACWGLFFALKIRRLRPGANLGTKGQHATSRQPKPLGSIVTFIVIGTVIYDKFSAFRQMRMYVSVNKSVKVKVFLVQALRLCTDSTAHGGNRGIALLRLCTGRTVHRGSRGIALLRLCTGRTAHGGNRGIALLFHDQRH